MPRKTTRLSYFSVLANLLTGGRAYRGGADSPAGFLTLTATGRTSGEPRTVHLIYTSSRGTIAALKCRRTGKMRTEVRRIRQVIPANWYYIRDGSAYVLTASNGGRPRRPGWFFNVRSNPRVTIDVHGTRLRAEAEVAGPEKRGELWARLLEIAPFYAGYEKRTRREIPMVLVRPIDGPEAEKAV